MNHKELTNEGDDLWKINPTIRLGLKTPHYYDWILNDWRIFYWEKITDETNPHEVTCRCFDTKTKEHYCIVVPAQFEFEFLGYAFVSHYNPNPKAYIEDGIPGGDYHISEAITGFKLSFGSSRDDARMSARKILRINAGGLHKKLNEATAMIHSRKWVVREF